MQPYYALGSSEQEIKNKNTPKPPDVYLDALKNASILYPALIFFQSCAKFHMILYSKCSSQNWIFKIQNSHSLFDSG